MKTNNSRMFIVNPYVPRRNNIRYIRSYPQRTFASNQNLMRQKYRMSTSHITKIEKLLEPLLPIGDDNAWNISNLNKVLITIRYLGTNAHQMVIADCMGLSQKAVSDSIDQITTALNHPNIIKKFIRFNMASPHDCAELSDQFSSMGLIPNVIGSIDGCLVEIQKPAHSGWQYYSRKGTTSINVLAIVDARGRFLYVNPKFPGSVHDSTVYGSSAVKEAFDNGVVPHGYCLIGDSGFGNSDQLVTPYRTPRTRQEKKFNQQLRKQRVIVEQAFGVWKRKFAILKSGLRVEPEKAAKIILATAVLYNMMFSLKCVKPRILGRRKAILAHPPLTSGPIRDYLTRGM